MEISDNAPSHALIPFEAQALSAHSFEEAPVERYTFNNEIVALLSTSAVIVFSFGIFFWGLSAGFGFWPGIVGGIMLVVISAVLGYLAVYPQLLPPGKSRIVLRFPSGMAYIDKRESRALRWEDIDSIFVNFQNVFGNRATRTTGYRLTIVPQHGTSLTFYTESLPRCRQLATVIRQHTAAVQLPELLHAHQNGEALYFKPLTLTPTHLANGEREIALNEIAAISFVNHDMLKITLHTGKYHLWRNCRVYQIPNLHLLLALVATHPLDVFDFDDRPFQLEVDLSL